MPLNVNNNRTVNFGLRLPVPHIEKIKIYDEYMEVQISVYVEANLGEEETGLYEDYESYLYNNLHIYLVNIIDFVAAEEIAPGRVLPDEVGDAGTRRFERLQSGDKSILEMLYSDFNGDQVPICLTGQTSPLSTGVTYPDNQTYYVKSFSELMDGDGEKELIYDDAGTPYYRYVMKFEVGNQITTSSEGADVSGRYGFYLDNIENNYFQQVNLACFSTCMDSQEIEDLNLNLDNDTVDAVKNKLPSVKLMQLKLSDISYEKLAENGKIGNSEFIVYRNASGGIVPAEVVMQSLDGTYYDSGASKIQLYSGFRSIIGATNDEDLQNMFDQLSLILETELSGTRLLKKIHQLTLTFTETSTATPVGSFYDTLQRTLAAANRAVMSGAPVSKQFVTSKTIVDLRGHVLTPWSAIPEPIGIYDLSRASNYIYVDQSKYWAFIDPIGAATSYDVASLSNYAYEDIEEIEAIIGAQQTTLEQGIEYLEQQQTKLSAIYQVMDFECQLEGNAAKCNPRDYYNFAVLLAENAGMTADDGIDWNQGVPDLPDFATAWGGLYEDVTQTMEAAQYDFGEIDSSDVINPLDLWVNVQKVKYRNYTLEEGISVMSAIKSEYEQVSNTKIAVFNEYLYGFWWFDYEKALRKASAISRIFDVRKLQESLGLPNTVFNTEFQLDSTCITKGSWQADNRGSAFTQRTNKEAPTIYDHCGSVITSYTYNNGYPEVVMNYVEVADNGTTTQPDSPALNMASHVPSISETEGLTAEAAAFSENTTGGTSVSAYRIGTDFVDSSKEQYTYSVLRSFNTKTSGSITNGGIEDYRLMCFEHQEVAGPLETDDVNHNSVWSTSFLKYKVKIKDSTVNIYNGIVEHYKNLMNGEFQDYYDSAIEQCSYNNIDGHFNKFFADGAENAYSDEPHKAPWITAPLLYHMHEDLLYDTYLGDNASIQAAALETTSNIHPRTGTLEQLEHFRNMMRNLYNTFYVDNEDGTTTPASVAKDYDSNRIIVFGQQPESDVNGETSLGEDFGFQAVLQPLPEPSNTFLKSGGEITDDQDIDIQENFEAVITASEDMVNQRIEDMISAGMIAAESKELGIQMGLDLMAQQMARLEGFDPYQYVDVWYNNMVEMFNSNTAYNFNPTAQTESMITSLIGEMIGMWTAAANYASGGSEIATGLDFQANLSSAAMAVNMYSNNININTMSMLTQISTMNRVSSMASMTNMVRPNFNMFP